MADMLYRRVAAMLCDINCAVRETVGMDRCELVIRRTYLQLSEVGHTCFDEGGGVRILRMYRIALDAMKRTGHCLVLLGSCSPLRKRHLTPLQG